MRSKYQEKLLVTVNTCTYSEENITIIIRQIMTWKSTVTEKNNFDIDELYYPIVSVIPWKSLDLNDGITFL